MNVTLKGFLGKEFRQTLRDKRMRVLLFVAPIMQLTLFGVALSNEVRNVRLASVFAPSDTMASQLFDRAFASGWFKPAQIADEGVDPYRWIESGVAEAVLIAPPGGLTRAVGRGEGQVQLLVNASNSIRAQAIESYVKAIAGEVLAASAAGQRPQSPLQLDVRVLYNPTLETSVYMVPGVMCMLVCMITILLTSMSLARERELGTFEMLIAAPVKPWEVIVGKTLPFITLGMIQMPLILIAAVILFGVPVRGSLLLLVGSALFFVATTVSIGTLISTIARNQQQAMLGGFLFLFPAILLSGLMFPLENMPVAVRAIAYMNPLSHFMMILRNILLKGGSPVFVLTHAAVLAVLATTTVTVSFKRFRTTLG